MNRTTSTLSRRVLLARPAAAVAAAAAILATTFCQRQPPAITDASTERNKTLVRRWIEEGFNKQRLSVVDELFADSFAVNGHVIGRDGLKQSMRRHLNGFPDLRVTIDDIIAEGPKVGIWYTVEATHGGEFEAIPPTGRHVTWVGYDLFRIENGKASEAHFVSDLLGLLTQLGASVSPPRAPDGARH